MTKLHRLELSCKLMLVPRMGLRYFSCLSFRERVLCTEGLQNCVPRKVFVILIGYSKIPEYSALGMCKINRNVTRFN